VISKEYLRSTKTDAYTQSHKRAAKFLNHSIDTVPHIVEQYTDYTQSGLKLTGNSLDFALKRGDAFFMVETPNGLKIDSKWLFYSR